MTRRTLLVMAGLATAGLLASCGQPKTPAATSASGDHGAAATADFSGTWNISSKVGQNPVSIQCTLAQSAAALTGTCKPQQFDPSPTTGTVTGSSATWGYDVVFNGNQNHVEYEATLGADGALSGMLHLGPMPTPFTAIRQ